MNSISLYTTTNQILLKANEENSSSWEDLYRLLPYLRNSISCVVCEFLLTDPISPYPNNCQHHMCKDCKTGRKKIKPACLVCKDCSTYVENKIIRILLQCYKKMCTKLLKSKIFHDLMRQASRKPPPIGVESGAGNLILLLKEGSEYVDDYVSEGGIPPSTYKLLPCVYTNRSVVPATTETLMPVPGPSQNCDVNYFAIEVPQNDNKVTIDNILDKKKIVVNTVNKKPTRIPPKPKMGCRCGNATIHPGKLTCCGQRCPCYVDSRACIDCKCRGCRNPRTLNGQKVRSNNEQICVPKMQYILPLSDVPPLVSQKVDYTYSQVNLPINSISESYMDHRQPIMEKSQILEVPQVQSHLLEVSGVQSTILELPPNADISNMDLDSHVPFKIIL